jgi:outer membrane receptor protein involved in Fe transport
VPGGGGPLQRQYNNLKQKVTTIRYTNVLSLQHVDHGGVSITSGAEYKRSSASHIITRATAPATFNIQDPDNNNYGAFVQVNPSYKNIYLTMGLRYEHNELFTNAWNPRVGLTTNFSLSTLTIKPRISWGKGIQAPSYEQRFGRILPNVYIIYPNPDLKPQSQQGFDYGIELYNKQGKFKFEAVFYDNLLQNMVFEEVLERVPSDTNLVGFIHKNVYELSNQGWEFSGEYHVGRFSLQGTLSLMKTTVGDTTGNHKFSELNSRVPGERELRYPTHIAGLNVNYNFNKVFGKADKGMISINISEVGGHQIYDRKGYNLDVAYGRVPYSPDTFAYTPIVSSIFRVGLYSEYYLGHDWRVFVQGSNILNDYKYELSSDILTYGATWLFGFKFSFTKKQ